MRWTATRVPGKVSEKSSLIMKIRKRHLPPLNAIRAFEAAARHLHLGKAADELAVTHGAISKHIANLEDHLGFPLFARVGNKLSLTERGNKLLQASNTALDQLGYAIARLDGAATEGELRISVPPAFATSWLIPRACSSASRLVS